jgi:hypothetical protein
VLATLEGYCVEGGFDRAYEPATCYSPTIHLGRHEGPGDAFDLWRDYERVIDLVPATGLDGVRLTLEWARLEPRPDEVDDVALERYRRAAAHAKSLGLRVTGVVVDAAWPSWLGQEAWLLPWVESRFVAHTRRVVAALADAVDAFVPFADVEGLWRAGFLDATAPPWRRGARADAQSARAQLERMEHAVALDPFVGPRLVRSWRELSLDQPTSVIADQRRSGEHLDELHVRSLVAGAGPTAGAVGLATRRDGVWSLSAPEALLRVLRGVDA